MFAIKSILFVLWVCYTEASKAGLLIDVIKSFSNSNGAYKVAYFFCDNNDALPILSNLSKNGFYMNGFHINSSSDASHNIPYILESNKAVYILELNCENSIDLIEKADQMLLFASPFRWILLNTNASLDQTEIETQFSKVNILINSEVILSNDFLENNFTLFKIFKRKADLPIIYEDFGNWSSESGLEIFEQIPDAAIRRSNLQGTVLTACLVITHNDTKNHLTDKRDKHIDTIAKVNYIFMQHIGNLLNATMRYTEQPSWGYSNNESKWNGMIGELTRRETDIGGTPLFLTSDRVPIIDYIAMTTPTKSKFVFRQPKLSYITNVFTLPFSKYVWISSAALVVITALALYLVTKWEWYKKRVYNIIDTKHTTDTELQDSAADVFFMAFGAICQQGAPAIPYNIAGRVITILLFISLMFLYTSYSANIVALLQSSSTSIQTLEDLLKSRLQVGVDDTVFNHFYFPNASEPIRRALYLQKVVPPGQKPRFYKIEEGVKLLRGGLFAFHMETGAGYKIVGETFMEDEKCGLEEIQFLQVPDPWLAIQKNSSFKKMLKIGLRKIQESGLQPREVSLLYTKKPVCISRGSSFIGVSIVDCYPAAVVLAGGTIASFCLFIIESLFYYRNNLLHRT